MNFEYSRITFSLEGQKNNNDFESNWRSSISSSKNGSDDFPVRASRTPKVKVTIAPFFFRSLVRNGIPGGLDVFYPAAMFAEAKVIILLRGLLPLFRAATSSPSSGRHVAAQIAGKGSAEARGIDYDAYVEDQRSEGGELPRRCCSLPISASTWKEVLDGDDWTLLSSVVVLEEPRAPGRPRPRDHVNA